MLRCRWMLALMLLTVTAGAAHAQPDLTTTILSLPSTVGDGSGIAVGVRLRNIGTSTAGAAAYRIYLSRNTTIDGSDILLTPTEATPSLAAQASVSATFNRVLPAGQVGTRFIIVQADPFDVVDEIREDNNTDVEAIQIIAQEKPDLVVTSLIVAPLTALEGEDIFILGTICNLGSASSGGFAWEIFVDGSRVASDFVSNLAPGACISGAELRWIGTQPPGDHEALLVADRDGDVMESDEGNNSQTEDFEVVAADRLTVVVIGQGSVTSSPEGIDCGTTCSASFATGTSVTLDTVAASAWFFDDWLEPACAGGILVMNGDQTCTAVFRPVRTHPHGRAVRRRQRHRHQHARRHRLRQRLRRGLSRGHPGSSRPPTRCRVRLHDLDRRQRLCRRRRHDGRRQGLHRGLRTGSAHLDDHQVRRRQRHRHQHPRRHRLRQRLRRGLRCRHPGSSSIRSRMPDPSSPAGPGIRPVATAP